MPPWTASECRLGGPPGPQYARLSRSCPLAQRQERALIELGNALKFVIDPSGCWIWNAAKNSAGYGKVCYKRSYWQAHRLAYVGTFNEDIKGKDIHHTCNNHACINPDHLVPLTRLEHISVTPQNPAYQNRTKTHCVRGHAFLPETTVMRKKRNGTVTRECQLCRHQRQKEGRAFNNPDSHSLLRANNTSGLRWVSWSLATKKWIAVVFGQYFGVYSDFDEAAYVADQVAIQLYVPDTKLNILTGPSIPWPSQTVDAT